MSKENIKNLINYLDEIELKTFKKIKNLSSSDQKILKKLILVKENLENLENLNLIIKKKSNEIGYSEKLLINKYNYFKKLNLI
jgi:mRNA-degrading endonuclease RelE of RelBE toxin-antitoxin system